ncbi:hypothetical protein FKM82_030552 [Ascaphus truei]
MGSRGTGDSREKYGGEKGVESWWKGRVPTPTPPCQTHPHASLPDPPPRLSARPTPTPLCQTQLHASLPDPPPSLQLLIGMPWQEVMASVASPSIFITTVCYWYIAQPYFEQSHILSHA